MPAFGVSGKDEPNAQRIAGPGAAQLWRYGARTMLAPKR
jgi:hypothetical protein